MDFAQTMLNSCQRSKVPNFSVASEKKWSKRFILSAGVLLFITGAAKIISALGKSAVLAKPDPMFGVPFNYLLLSVGLLELFITVVCLLPAKQNIALGLVAALSINFCGYRVGLWLTHWEGYCPCLGSLTQAIHMSRHQADLLTRAILVYLMLGSFSFLASSSWALKEKRRSAPERSTLAVISDFWLPARSSQNSEINQNENQNENQK